MIEKFLIGTYTHSISKGIYQLELDTQAKQLQNLQLVAEATNPTYLAESDAHRIYSVDKVLGPNDEAQGGVLVLDDQIPANQVDLQLDPGANPAYLAIDEPRQLVYTANYHLGTVSVYRILADGSLELTDRKTDQGMVGPRPEQADGPHPHFANVTPDGRLVVVDLGIDKLFLYDITDDGKLTLVSEFEMESGFGPRHITFDNQKGVAYLVGELSSNLAVLEYNEEAATFAVKQIISTIPDDWTAHNGAAAVRMSSDGRFVYVSNRGNNTIAVFETAEDGMVTLVQRIATEGDFPRDFNFNSDERFVIVPHQNSGNASLFERDAQTGKLTLIQKDFAVPEGICVAPRK
ncbi:carboxy-cis,cis-muconate cyclase [Lentilactobacillus senioris DSM 24302 = JCM 17472]|uniref:Carboxy-cis,cis-muconate cyclase n=1 Tax=Lentilactobacillus senioris DSM 24302 = JCM 17472 TaxID=1423802 RepID=A0A0R2CP19_9LACO|nr:lactonase family protein [Lentilactobacillus senioris]KRM93255.1 carboxy-cis,cis-muconate cyclase [Lentilactobacillus senioris DSM 24302 = JCM 17472]